MSAETQEKPLGLKRKLALIRRGLKSLPKNGYNAHHKYKFVRAEDAVAKAQRLLDRHDVLLIPGVEGDLQQHGSLTLVPLTYTFEDIETGEQLPCAWAGSGTDKGDKGLYKAYTGALKYFLIQFFQIKVGHEDPEASDPTGARTEREGTPRIPRDRALRIADAAKAAGLDATGFGALLTDKTDGRVSQAGKVGQLNVNEAQAVEAAIAAEAGAGS